MNDIRVMKYETWSDLRSLQDVINRDFNKCLGEIICVDGFAYGLDSTKLVVTVAFREEEHSRKKYKIIVDYYNEEVDDWLVKSNYCIPPKLIPVGPRKDAIVVIAVLTVH